MRKHNSIIYILDRLHKELPNAKPVDYWDADLFAIGIKNTNRLVYISTFSSIKRKDKEIIYDYSFEIEPTGDVKDIIYVSDTKDANEEDMLVDIKNFFNNV